MTPCSRILRANAARIAKAAAAVADAEDFEQPLRELVEVLYEDAACVLNPDLTGLQRAVGDDVLVWRMLRAAEAEIIEILRGELPETAFHDAVLLCRARIRRAYPRYETDPWCAELARALRGEASQEPRLSRFLDSVVNTARDIVYAHDVNGWLFFLNTEGLAMVRYSQQDVDYGLSVYDLVVPKYVDLVEARLESPGAAQRSPYSIEIYAKDGERIPIEISTQPLLGDHNEVLAVVGVARDMRLERRLQEEIRRSNSYFETLQSTAPIGVLVLNAAGRIESANRSAAAILGALSTDHLYRSDLSALVPGEEGTFSKAMENTCHTGEISWRMSAESCFGKSLQCDVTLSRLSRHHDQVDGYLLLLSDVSEQVALQESLLRSEKLSALGELIAGVAHELNNPLTGILGYAQMLNAGINDPRQQDRLNSIIEEAQRCRRVVQNLLSFAQRGESTKSLVDLNRLVKECLELCEYQLATDKIRVTCELAPEMPALRADAQGLQRALLNIVKNAHEALMTITDRTRTITVKTRVEANNVQVIVEDNGPGIPADARARVFDPFFTTRAFGNGMGLGLSVAYGIVREHKGNILLESEEGRGTRFDIVLPK